MKKGKDNIKLFLLILVLCITIGYAALTSNLTINGTSTINNASWDVHWNNVVVTNGSVTGTNVTTAAHILTGNTEVEYSITLSNPGDFYEFTVDAVNAGTIDAMIGSFSNKVYQSNGTTERTLPDYLTYTVTYNDGVSLATNQLLAANTTETYKVRVEFKTDIDPEDLPSSLDTLIFKFNVNYVQADDNAIERHHSITGIRYADSDLPINIGDTAEELTLYETSAAARASLREFWMHDSDIPFCLKLTITNDIVTDIEIEFIVSQQMVSENPGMTAGTYVLKYGNNYYSENITTMQTAFGLSRCDEDSTTRYVCQTDYMDADIDSSPSCGVAITSTCGCEFSHNGAHCWHD